MTKNALATTRASEISGQLSQLGQAEAHEALAKYEKETAENRQAQDEIEARNDELLAETSRLDALARKFQSGREATEEDFREGFRIFFEGRGLPNLTDALLDSAMENRINEVQSEDIHGRSMINVIGQSLFEDRKFSSATILQSPFQKRLIEDYELDTAHLSHEQHSLIKNLLKALFTEQPVELIIDNNITETPSTCGNNNVFTEIRKTGQGTIIARLKPTRTNLMKILQEATMYRHNFIATTPDNKTTSLALHECFGGKTEGFNIGSYSGSSTIATAAYIFQYIVGSILLPHLFGQQGFSEMTGSRSTRDLYSQFLSEAMSSASSRLERQMTESTETVSRPDASQAFKMVYPVLRDKPLLAKALEACMIEAYLSAERKEPGSGEKAIIPELCENKDELILTAQSQETALVPAQQTGFWQRFFRRKMAKAQSPTSEIGPNVQQYYQGYVLARFFRTLAEKLEKHIPTMSSEYREDVITKFAFARGVSEALAKQAGMLETSLDMATLGDGFDLDAMLDGVTALKALRENPASRQVAIMMQDFTHRVAAATEIGTLDTDT